VTFVASADSVSGAATRTGAATQDGSKLSAAARMARRTEVLSTGKRPNRHRGGIEPSLPAAFTHQAAGKGKIGRAVRAFPCRAERGKGRGSRLAEQSSVNVARR